MGYMPFSQQHTGVIKTKKVLVGNKEELVLEINISKFLREELAGFKNHLQNHNGRTLAEAKLEVGRIMLDAAKEGYPQEIINDAIPYLLEQITVRKKGPRLNSKYGATGVAQAAVGKIRTELISIIKQNYPSK
jgi:hypothetical protein